MKKKVLSSSNLKAKSATTDVASMGIHIEDAGRKIDFQRVQSLGRTKTLFKGRIVLGLSSLVFLFRDSASSDTRVISPIELRIELGSIVPVFPFLFGEFV